MRGFKRGINRLSNEPSSWQQENVNTETETETETNTIENHKVRLRNNKFNEYERNILHYEENMSEEEIETKAKDAVQYTQIADYVDKLEEAKTRAQTSGDYTEYNDLVRGLNSLEATSSDVARIQELTNIYSIITVEESHQAEVANTVAETINMQSGDEEVETLLTETVLTHADNEESIQTFVVNNIEHEEIINNVVETIIEQHPEIAERIDLKAVVEQGFQKAEEMGIERPSVRNKNAEKSGTTNNNGKTTINNTSTKPTLSSKQQTLADKITAMRQASEELYNPVINVDENNTPDSSGINSEINRFKELLPAVNKNTNPIARTQLKKEISQNFENIIKDFDSIESSDKDFIKNYLKRAMPDVLFSIYLKGSNEVRSFINDGGYIKPQELFHYLATHPAEKKTASPEILDAFEEYMTEQNKT